MLALCMFFVVFKGFLGGGFNFFKFQPYLGKWSDLTNIFPLGWFNHQLGFTVSPIFERHPFYLGFLICNHFPGVFIIFAHDFLIRTYMSMFLCLIHISYLYLYYTHLSSFNQCILKIDTITINHPGWGWFFGRFFSPKKTEVPFGFRVASGLFHGFLVPFDRRRCWGPTWMKLEKSGEANWATKKKKTCWYSIILVC